jgi:hypothetical protein
MRAFRLASVLALLVIVLVGPERSVVLATCPPRPISFTRTQFTVDAAIDGPKVIALGDLNKDGKDDVVVSSAAGDQVDVYLNNGSGAFPNAAQSFSTAASPVAVVIGNFNGDGKPDLAVVSAAEDLVSILLGDGTGDFSNRRDVSVSSGPVSVVAADFNGDGIDDLAVLSDTQIDILRNDGSGNFSPFPGSPVSTRGSASSDLVAGRLNGDSFVDIAVANRDTSQVVVFLGKGDGTFQSPTFNPVGPGPAALALADLDSDGKLDLAVVNADAIADQNVSLLYGNGDGTFRADVRTTAETFATAIALADFDGDGKIDMAVTSDSGGGDLVIEHNDPDNLDPGGPACLIDFQSGFSRFSLSIGSLVAVQQGQINGDGRPDLVALSSDGTTVWVFTNVLEGPVPTDTPTASPSPMSTFTPTASPNPAAPNLPSLTSPTKDERGCSIDRPDSTGRTGLWLVTLPVLVACRRRRRRRPVAWET